MAFSGSGNRQYNARKGFHNATGGNVTQTEWSDDRPCVEPSSKGSQN